MINLDIYTELKENHITQKRVAEQLHMTESNFSQLLKTELTGKRAGTKALIFAIIKRLAAEDIAKAREQAAAMERSAE